MLIRKIIPAAIDYRMHERRPLTRKELNDLSDCLLKLEIDMRDELRDVALDATLPRITVPPDELVKRLRNHNLDPAISSEPFQLFKDGHFNEATRRAGEKFEDQVQQYSQISKIGRSLMGDAFTNDHLMDISGIQPKNQQGFTEGYKLLTMGAMAAIRNVFSHGNEERRTPEECYEMLMFFNWLFRYLKSPEGTDIT
ncbi:MAG: TIGR02391 family protein [Firmicutes bacterium]|nr:TIGR02391 family protein [Bacillota bacterium]